MPDPIRVLVLEDEEYRAQFFRERLGAVVVNDPDEFLRVLRANLGSLEAVYLDRDLNWHVADPYPREVTGEDVVSRYGRTLEINPTGVTDVWLLPQAGYSGECPDVGATVDSIMGFIWWATKP